MKRFAIGLAAALAVPAFALAQTTEKQPQGPQNKAPAGAADQAVPEMKNPGGTEGLHPPQKAMDEATESAPGKTDSSTGASSGTAGSGSTSGSNATEPKPGSKY
jgi:hypothetical protein